MLLAGLSGVEPLIESYRVPENVTLPARQFTVGGDRRSFSLLRYVDNPAAQDRLRDFLLEAYQAHEREVEQTATS